MRRPSVVVLDYGSGNLRSAERALQRAGAQVSVTAEPGAALAADGLVVPGVGAFASCRAGLDAVGGGELLGRRLDAGGPVLGICVGMQVLFAAGVERGVATPGFDRWPGTVELLAAPILPHIGWNTVEAAAGSALFKGLDGERFYFVHSYAVTEWAGPRGPLVSWSVHGERFAAAVEDGPLTATQFHPEKSGDAGATLLEHWLESLG